MAKSLTPLYPSCVALRSSEEPRGSAGSPLRRPEQRPGEAERAAAAPEDSPSDCLHQGPGDHSAEALPDAATAELPGESVALSTGGADTSAGKCPQLTLQT